MISCPDDEPSLTSSHSPGESGAWGEIEGTWKQLFGNFDDRGVSIEWHEFSTHKTIDWARSFHPGSLEVCLNFSGNASLRQGRTRHPLAPGQVALYTTTQHRPTAERHAGHVHRFFTIELSAQFLRNTFGDALFHLLPQVQTFVEDPEAAKPWVQVLTMASSLLAYRVHLVEPPVPKTAQAFWYLGKVTEILSHLIFVTAGHPDDHACPRHKRQNRERCERVLFLIERDLENPPSLEMLAKEVQCSPYHLSRMLAQEMRVSIPKYLRMKRMEKAAEILRGGKVNVTEAAMAVGYSSLSAFNKAFVEHVGCCPGLYPHLKTPPKPRAAA